MKMRSTLALLAAGALVLSTATGAHASNWAGATGLTGCAPLNKADNKEQTWYPSSISSTFSSQITWAMDYTDSIPNVSTTKMSAVSSATDQVFYDAAYTSHCDRNWWTSSGGGVIGAATCVSVTNKLTGECEKHEVRLHTGWGSSVSTTARRSLVLHETGHALGLRHRAVDGDLMESSHNGSTTYGSHNTNHFASL